MSDLPPMTGLEMLHAMIVGEHPSSSMAATMTMGFVEAEVGRVVMSARADERYLNPLGLVHGGFASTVLDSVTGCAVHSTLEAGAGYATIDLHIKMLRPVPRDELLTAEGILVHKSRSLATSDGTLKTSSGKLLATATATCFLRQPS